MNKDTILSELSSLETPRVSSPTEPVQLSGWYANQDGTVTRWDWVDGGRRVRDAVTLRSFGDVDRYEELCRRGAML